MSKGKPKKIKEFSIKLHIEYLILSNNKKTWCEPKKNFIFFYEPMYLVSEPGGGTATQRCLQPGSGEMTERLCHTKKIIGSNKTETDAADTNWLTQPDHRPPAAGHQSAKL